jgi:hypothetical protein
MKSLWLVLILTGVAEARTTSYALVIGNNAPPETAGESLPKLKYADDDAARLFQFFQRFGGRTRLLSVLDAESQHRYPELAAQARPPTVGELKAAVDELATWISADVARGDSPVVYFTFSGHGALDPEGEFFLSLADGKLSQRQLYGEVVDRLEPAFVHLFIDACHSESLVSGRGTQRREVEVPMAAVDPSEAQAAFAPRLPERFSRLGVIIATTVDQQAHEWSRLESGVFTHELLSALSGAADVNGDGAIEYSEVQAFIASANRELKDPRATPKVVALAPRVNIHVPLVELGKLQSVGFLAGYFSWGHFFIELESGQRLLDANLDSRQAGMIALPAGRVFVQTPNQELALTVHAGETTRVESLSLGARSATARGSVEAALSRALFESAFGTTYYQGYVDSLGASSVAFGGPTRLEVLAQTSRRKWVAAGALGFSGALLVTSAVSTAEAIGAYREYERTTLQRPAFEARQRSNNFAIAAAISGGAAVAVGLAGAWLWPTEAPLTASAYLGPDGAAVTFAARW